ncbi:YdcF family protein [Caenispirillum bisanense]|uniref:YdcF family protein n=1 Tax=Caenispirillum bisanense TaxID=414052 RepID=UPI0031D9163A
MSFYLSKILWLIVQPHSLLVLALLAVLVFGRMGRRTRWALGAVTAVVVAVAVLPLGTWLLRPLDERFPPPTPEQVEQAPGIILLGGAMSLAMTSVRPGYALSARAERYTETALLAHAFPEKPIAFTGGSGAILDQEVREGPLARSLLEGLGIAPERLIVESDSRSTAEHPALLAPLLPPGAPGEGWLLVTSAWHMPRAMGVFQAAGWQVVPYPVDYATAPAGGWLPGLLNGLAGLYYGVHEWAGLIYYHAMGYTDEVFPAP